MATTTPPHEWRLPTEPPIATPGERARFEVDALAGAAKAERGTPLPTIPFGQRAACVATGTPIPPGMSAARAFHERADAQAFVGRLLAHAKARAVDSAKDELSDARIEAASMGHRADLARQAYKRAANATPRPTTAQLDAVALQLEEEHGLVAAFRIRPDLAPDAARAARTVTKAKNWATRSRELGRADILGEHELRYVARSSIATPLGGSRRSR